MELYLILLKALLKGENYRLYRKGIDASFLETNYPNLAKVLYVIDDLQKSNLKDYSVNEVQIRLYTLYPRITPKSFDELFAALHGCGVDDRVVEEYLRQAATRRTAFNIAERALRIADGREVLHDFLPFLKELPNEFEEQTVITDPDEDFVTDDLEELYESRIATPGLRWRLKSFNAALGSLRKGNFGFIYARPEAGKSTFIASECTHMATQADGTTVWFDNEEEGKDVKIRVYQAALGKTQQELWQDRAGNRQAYKDLMQGRFKVASNGSITRQYVEDMCKRHNPKLIIINQLDKVKGFSADRHDLMLKAIYQWARELAKEYGPTIGVCQAGSSGEDKKYLEMTDVDSSHTAKQGEADWILGIGQTHDQGFEPVRYFHLSKNKLMGDSDTDPTMRHGKWSALIVPDRARYKDFDDNQ